MAERVTLEQVMEAIEDLGSIIQAGFAYNEKKFTEMAVRFEDLKDKTSKEFRAIKDDLGGVKYGIHKIQKDFIALDEEVRGIHKVIDKINIRVMALEKNLGATPLFPAT